jgi:hypothetical protein
MNLLEVRDMKANISPQSDQVVLDAGAQNMRLLTATTTTGTAVIATVIEEVNSFQTELADRASRQTRVLAEILSRDARRTI